MVSLESSSLQSAPRFTGLGLFQAQRHLGIFVVTIQRIAPEGKPLRGAVVQSLKVRQMSL